MAEYNHEKLYFLKLPKGFFKRHDLLILEALPNGKEYSLFYLKLMLESLDHDGYLRYNNLIPYDATMLSAVTNTNIDIVRVAIKILEDMQLVEILDDKTIYMRKVEEMTYQTTVGASKKQQQFMNREQGKIEGGGQRVENFPPEYRVKSIEEKESMLKHTKEKDIDTLLHCNDTVTNIEADSSNNVSLSDTTKLIPNEEAKEKLKQNIECITSTLINDKATAEEIATYFNAIYDIYPRKISKIKAREAFEHKIRGLDRDNARTTALTIYKKLEWQKQQWDGENGGHGRDIDKIPYMSSWLNANIEDSKHFKKRRA